MAAVQLSHEAALSEAGLLYRELTDTIPLMVWSARADGAVDYVNRRVLEYTGLPARDLLARGWEAIVHPDDRARCAEAWTRALESGTSAENEMRLRRADGQYRWHHRSGVPVRGADGGVARWFGICTDVEGDEQRRELRRAHARLHALLENEPDECVKVLDAQGRLLEMNAAGLRMIEAEHFEDVTGRCVYDFIAREHVGAFRDLTERVCRGERGGLEFELVGLKGARRRLETQAVPLHDEASGEPRVLAITRDITERRRAEQALRESERRFQLFLDHLPASAWIRDADFRYTYANRRYAAEWKVEPAALLGQNAAELFPPEIAEYFRETDRKVAREGAPMQFTDSLPSGRWLKMKFPVPDGRGGTGVAGIALDIAERSRLEQALSESERRFQSFMEHVPAAAWIKDERFRYTYVNQAYAEVYGRAPREVLARDDFDLHGAELAAFFRQEDEKIAASGQATQRTHELPYADGRPGHWLVTKFPLADGAGKVGVAGIAVDITERNRLEEALRASEQRFRTFMHHAPARAWIKDARLRYTYVNAAFARDHRRAPQDFLGREDFELFPAGKARYFREHDEQILRGVPPQPQLRQVAREDGLIEHWLVAKFPLADGAGGTGLAGIAFDVTDRVAAEQKAQRYAAEVRTLVNRLVQAQEAERRRVADGLHDLIGQNLTALGIDLQALRQTLGSAGEGAAGARLDAMAALLASTIDGIRGVMTDLRPVALEEFGLAPALRWYASQFAKRTGLKASTKAPRRELRLAPDAELALFRIAQEALTNAAKHSGGTRVQIRIRYGRRVTLTVEDDGRGFAETGRRSAVRGGFGLTTMRERAEAQGGTLRIEFPQRGTRVVAEIPAGADDD
jgi:PAS domain S-box-containing protein